MKQIASNYTYSPTTNVVTLTSVNIDQDQLLLVVAPQVGRTMYNFASGVTGAVSAGTDTRVTLNASTVGLTTTSPLVIFYDDQAVAQAVTGTVALDPASLIALENVTVTIGSSVTIAGTVTASNLPVITDGESDQPLTGVQIAFYDAAADMRKIVKDDQPLPVSIDSVLPISGTVTVGASSVTFNAYVGQRPDGTWSPISLAAGSNYVNTNVLNSIIGTVTVGVVSQGAFGATINGYSTDTGGQLFQNCVPVKLFHGSDACLGAVTVGNSVTIGSLPSGALTTRFGSVVTANLAAITSAVTNTSRKYLLAQNISAGTVTIGIGFSPTTTQGIQLPAGGGLTFDAFCPTGAVYWLGAVTGAAFTILEG